MTVHLREYRITFGQQYRHNAHSYFPRVDADGWLTVLADSYGTVKDLVGDALLHGEYSNIHEVDEDQELDPVDWLRYWPHGSFAWLVFPPYWMNHEVQKQLAKDYGVTTEPSARAAEYKRAMTVACTTCGAGVDQRCQIVKRLAGTRVEELRKAGWRISDNASSPHTARVLDAAAALAQRSA